MAKEGKGRKGKGEMEGEGVYKWKGKEGEWVGGCRYNGQWERGLLRGSFWVKLVFWGGKKGRLGG